jgi:hypothetical protein
MFPLDRRTLLRLGLAGGATALAGGAFPSAAPAAPDSPPSRLGWVGAGAFTQIYDPTPTGEKQYLNDHTFIRDRQGNWHLFGITGPVGKLGQEVNFAHATARRLTGPWKRQPYALTADPDYWDETQIWAPTVIEVDGVYHMFSASVRAGGFGMTLARSTDLYHWKRLETGPVFFGIACRDPYVTRIDNQWVMFYCELAAVHSNHIVGYRTSSDLIHWSEQKVAFTDAATDDLSVSVTESPVVLQRDGWWYLFIGPRNGYVGTDVYRSKNPLGFSVNDYAGHIPAHAAEIIQDGPDWWVSAAGWFQGGVALAPLKWQATPPVWQTPENPAVALDKQGLLHVFALDRHDQRIIHRVQLSSTYNLWGPWQTFSEQVAAVPTVGHNADGRLEVFAVGRNGAKMIHRAQDSYGSWGNWRTFGGSAGASPTISRQADGRLEAFALGPAGAYVQHRTQKQPNSPDWTDWAEFGGAAGAPPVVGTNADGRLEVFALGPGGAYLAHRWQLTPNGEWSGWEGFGTAAGKVPTVARDATGRMNVFALRPSGWGVAVRPQAQASGGWGDWQDFGYGGGADAPPHLVAHQDGRLDAFVIPTGGARITHRWQSSATDPSWHADESFGDEAVTATPSAALDAAGRLHVFAVLRDGTVRERVQSTANGGWRPWSTFGYQRVATVPAGSAT